MLPILLTASVDTRGMKGAMFSALDREKMYVDTLNFYINEFAKHKETFSLVFVENSGWKPLSILKQLSNAENVNVEYISLDPKDFDISKGKSYNEMKLIDMAIGRSKAIKTANAFFKVTGRFPILNLFKLLKEVQKRGGDKMRFYCDCKDHKVYELLHIPINGHAGECRYYAVSLSFYKEYFKGKYSLLDDNIGKSVETFFFHVIRQVKKQDGVYCRFRTQAHLTGAGGHTLGHGMAFFCSTDNDSVALKFKRGIRQLLRWLLPWWWC